MKKIEDLIDLMEKVTIAAFFATTMILIGVLLVGAYHLAAWLWS